MPPQHLQGVWLNGHIRDLLDEKNRTAAPQSDADPTAKALKEALLQAEKVVEAARFALRSYAGVSQTGVAAVNGTKKNGFVAREDIDLAEGLNRRGPTSRELSGEMGGDTAVRV